MCGYRGLRWGKGTWELGAWGEMRPSTQHVTLLPFSSSSRLLHGLFPHIFTPTSPGIIHPSHVTLPR